jgi:asparagine synthase (glutamine-hydrolysing)
MCGFFFDTKTKLNNDTLELIASKLKHRGPDNTQIYTNENAHLSTVFSRLAIQDLSPLANQPFFSRCKKHMIVYNGEIFNVNKLRNKLSKDISFETNSDTEILLLNLIEFGIEATLNLIDGMFAFIYTNFEKQETYAARDMFGIKPLYFSKNNSGGYSFASEIKALTVNNKFDLNSSLIREFIICGLIDHTKETFFNQICRVEPGTYLVIKNDKLETKKWLELNEQVHKFVSIDECVEILESTLNRSFIESLISDVPVNLMLSSGIDSNLIRSLYSDNGFNLKLHSVSWGDGEFSEIDKISLSKDTLDNLTIHNFTAMQTMDLILDSYKIYDEPYTSAFSAVWPKVFKDIKASYGSVVIDGNGADELFLGYKKYLNSSFHNFPNLALDGNDVSLGFESYFIKDPKNLYEANALDISKLKLPRSLRFLDYSSMSASVEARPIFLTKSIFQMTRNIPVDWMLNDGHTKYPLRKILFDHGFGNLAFREKQNIQYPQNTWMLKEWKSMIDQKISNIDNIMDHILDSKERNALKKVVNDFQNSIDMASLSVIWRVFITVLWFEKLLRENI